MKNNSYDVDNVDDFDAELRHFIENADCERLNEERFNQLAIREFQYQFLLCDAYTKFCVARNKSPSNVTHWTEIPAVPTEAFKEAVIATCKPEEASYVYQTSGTSTAGSRPGMLYRDERAYNLCRTAWKRAAKEYLLPDRRGIRTFLLAPSPELVPTASIGHCLGAIMEAIGTPGSGWFLGPSGYDYVALATELTRAETDGIPVLVIGATYSILQFFDWCEGSQQRFRLPAGSRINHGSGFKGRSREVTRMQFLDETWRVLGIPETHNVNVLGATELGSQMYDNVFRNLWLGIHERRFKKHLPWTRTRVVDPTSLESLPDGEVGILMHYDLAQRGNAVAIQTEDLGLLVEDGFEIIGRVQDAEARGCSLLLEQLFG
jgi:hypothetical protein